jgi:hypothetical protein
MEQVCSAYDGDDQHIKVNTYHLQFGRLIFGFSALLLLPVAVFPYRYYFFKQQDCVEEECRQI